MTPEETALRDAWIAELWPVCREVSREDRAVEKVRQGLGRNALTWEDDAEQLHTKTGRTVLVTPLPGPDPRIGRAPVNHAPSDACRQQVSP